MRCNFYSVSVMTSKDDDGFAVTFDSEMEADRYRVWAIEQGCFYVSPVWR